MNTGSRSLTGVWFDLARAGNFPSVCSNVLAALALSTPVAAAWPDARTGLLAALGGMLAYAGGTTLNDVFDAGFDRRHRPDRAIPSGIISRSLAGWVGAIQLAAGAALLLVLPAKAALVLGLVACILLYDWLHKRWTGSVVLMAGCRVLLGLTLASVPGHAFTPALVSWVVLLGGYIIVLSLLARREYLPGAPKIKLGRQVGRLLAFIPLVDALALLSVGAWPIAIVCALAIPLGRLAQRLSASN
ncbi:MAG TPA: UbiA family prenyltransferase [Opitutaceae bacterium]